MSGDVTLERLIKEAIDYRLFDLHVSMPGRVKKYDASKQLADVECLLTPTLKTDDGDEPVVLGVITNVPIEFPGGGGYFLSFPLAAGDGVRLTFHDRSLDVWQKNGGLAAVSDLRTHHLTDATAYPGLRAEPDKLASAHASKLVLGKDGNASMQITIDGTTIKLSDNAANFVALANLVLTELQALATNVNTNWPLIASAIAAVAAPLIAPPPGTPVTTTAPVPGMVYTPVTAATPASVAATKVKAE
jgi:hypothetical protein